MTSAEASTVREELRQVQPLIEEKVAVVQELRREFHLTDQSTFGAQCHEFWLYLRDLGEKINAVDSAISDTDTNYIEQALNDLEQLQLSVMQLEETLRGCLISRAAC